MRVRLGALAALVLILTASACGGGRAVSPSPEDSPAPTIPLSPSGESATVTPSVSSAGGSQLTIVVDDGSGTRSTWTLTCDPVGGTHPDPEAACRALADHLDALDPVPKDKMCAQVYGGPERATISGTWQDRTVAASLSRVDSCETARWDALVPLVPSGGR